MLQKFSAEYFGHPEKLLLIQSHEEHQVKPLTNQKSLVFVLLAPSWTHSHSIHNSLYIGSFSLTPRMLRLLSSKARGSKDFLKPSKPCHVGIHWKALAA